MQQKLTSCITFDMQNN